MESKLQEITEKIYNEGVEKANSEAEQIIDNANKKASEIIDSAKAESESIIQNAKKESDDYRKRTESEIKKAGDQSLKSIKNSINNLLTSRISEGKIEDAVNDDNIIGEIIVQAAKSWPESGEFKVFVPEDKKKSLEKYVNGALKNELKNKIEFGVDKSVKGGFYIQPEDGSYQIRFEDDDFNSLFKSFLKPSVSNLLFS